jgi:hypothetical protein
MIYPTHIAEVPRWEDDCAFKDLIPANLILRRMKISDEEAIIVLEAPAYNLHSDALVKTSDWIGEMYNRVIVPMEESLRIAIETKKSSPGPV